MSGVADYTALIKKIVPVKDGETPTVLRTGLIAGVNGDGTVDVTISGVTLADKPVLGTSVLFTIGQAVQVLTTKGKTLVLGGTATAGSVGAAMPCAHVLFGTPSIPNNAFTALTPTSVPVNVGGMWVSGSTFTIPTDQGGYYEIGEALQYASQSPASGQRHARLRVNGADFTYAAHTAVGLDGTLAPGFVVGRRVMSAGDTVTFGAYQVSGGALLLNASSHGWIQRIR